MIVKESIELEFLTKKATYELIEVLIKSEILDNIPENYGMRISQCIDMGMTISEFSSIMQLCEIYPNCKNYSAIMDLVLLGDGDCVECGGEMEFINGEEKQVGGDGYLTPREYEPIWQEKKCMNCGYIDSNQPD